MKLSKVQVLLVLCIVAVFSVFLTNLVYNNYNVLYVESFEMHIEVGDGVGMNADTDKLWFGEIPARSDSLARKNIVLENTFDVPVKVVGKVQGDMAKWVTLVDQGIEIQPGEGASFTVVVSPTKEETFFEANYTGELIIYMKRV